MLAKKPLLVEFGKEDTTKQILPRPPILSSLKAGWNNTYLEYHRQPSGEHEEICTSGHTVAVFTKICDRNNRAERTLDGCFYQHSVSEGDLIITPAYVGHKSSWYGESEFILFGFDPNVFARAIDESAQSEQVQLIPQVVTSDLLVLQMGLVLKKVLENNLYDRIYVDAIANALAVHLIQYYSSRKPMLREYCGGLSQRKLKQVIDYIHANIDCDLGLQELAYLVGMSPRYFSLLFKQSTKLTPHQYVILTRVERAKVLLQQGQISIADIAQNVGFANQSHLNLHFKRLVGITPKQFSQR
jgi:AraC family transcriptional regulator